MVVLRGLKPMKLDDILDLLAAGPDPTEQQAGFTSEVPAGIAPVKVGTRGDGLVVALSTDVRPTLRAGGEPDRLHRAGDRPHRAGDAGQRRAAPGTAAPAPFRPDRAGDQDVEQLRVADAGPLPDLRVLRRAGEARERVDLVDHGSRSRVRRPGRKKSTRIRPRQPSAWKARIARSCSTSVVAARQVGRNLEPRPAARTWRRSRRSPLRSPGSPAAGRPRPARPGAPARRRRPRGPVTAGSTSTFSSNIRAAASASGSCHHCVHPGDAQAGPGPRRLDEHRQPQPLLVGPGQVDSPGRSVTPPATRRPVGREQRLGDRLVHAGGAGQHAVADVRHADPLQHAPARCRPRRTGRAARGRRRPGRRARRAPPRSVTGVSSTCHCPSRPINTSVTGYASLRLARMLAADLRDTSCSPLRPPNSTRDPHAATPW